MTGPREAEALASAGVTLTLTADEALVLFEWLVREGGRGTVPREHQAEQTVLWSIEAQLERTLAEPLRRDYVALLAAARERVAGDAE